MDGPGRHRDENDPAWTELLDRLFVRARKGMVLGLERLEPILEHFGHPERTPAIHVAGSNGKGSTAAWTAGLLSFGRRTGLFTSPHLFDLCERIQFGERAVFERIARAELKSILEEIESAPSSSELTFFEIMTAAGLVAFARGGVLVSVVEAGLGARLDATRLVDARVSILTDLSIEHSAILGDSIEAIAFEKSFVMRPGKPIVSADHEKPAMDLVRARAKEEGAKLYVLGEDFRVFESASGLVDFDMGDRKISEVRLSLLGPHQMRNAALALKAALLFVPGLSDEAVRSAFVRTRWPGRLELFEDALSVPVLLDGAHNPQGARALANALVHLRDRLRPPFHFVFGALADKDLLGMFEALSSVAHSWTLTVPSSDRAKDPRELSGFLRAPGGVSIESNARHALDSAEQKARKQGGTVVVCGSLHLVGELRKDLETE